MHNDTSVYMILGICLSLLFEFVSLHIPLPVFFIELMSSLPGCTTSVLCLCQQSGYNHWFNAPVGTVFKNWSIFQSLKGWHFHFHCHRGLLHPWLGHERPIMNTFYHPFLMICRYIVMISFTFIAILPLRVCHVVFFRNITHVFVKVVGRRLLLQAQVSLCSIVPCL